MGCYFFCVFIKVIDEKNEFYRCTSVFVLLLATGESKYVVHAKSGVRFFFCKWEISFPEYTKLTFLYCLNLKIKSMQLSVTYIYIYLDSKYHVKCKFASKCIQLYRTALHFQLKLHKNARIGQLCVSWENSEATSYEEIYALRNCTFDNDALLLHLYAS